MKKLFTILAAGVFAVAVNAQQEEITLSQTNDQQTPENAGILSCNDSDNGYGRVFNLADYGLADFTPTAVDAAAIVWDGGYTEGHIYTLSDAVGDYPESFSFDDMTDTGFSAFFGNNTGERIWDWVSLEVFDEVDAPLTGQFYLTIVGPISNADAGWAGSFVPLPTGAGYIKSAYFGDPNSECGAGDDDVNRLDVVGFGDPYGAILLTVTGYAEGQGLVKLESNQLAVYPNPATDVINIRMKDNASIQNVNIVNMAGQSVFNSKVTGSSVNVSSLAPGVYVVRVTDNNNVTHMSKLIKK